MSAAAQSELHENGGTAADQWNVDSLPEPSAGANTVEAPAALVCRLVDLKPAAVDDGNTLLGFRFLCRGSGCLFVGASGIGKSTAVMQMAICWSVGRPCFGIAPPEPLKILYIQAENDDGDLCEMRDGVFEHLDELTPDEGRALEENFYCAFESSRAGHEFISKTLEPLLREHTPDLVIIDPVLSYLGGDANDQKVVGPFLRNLINPLLQNHRCGALIVHHTPKQNGDRDSKGKVATDFAYAGTGSAEWANWARGVLVLRAKDDYGLRELRIAKRFRLGWKDVAGKPSHSRLLRQNSEGGSLFYSELSSEEATVLNPKLSPFDRIIQSHDILPEIGQDMSQCALIARIQQSKICGRDAARDVIALLVEEKYLIKREADRSGARPEIRYERTEKRHNVVAFG